MNELPMTPSPLRDVLTPEALGLMDTVYRTGSMAAAARELGLVPSAVTYRVRQLEDALDVLLFDRSSRQAKLTEAGKELLREGNRLLNELEQLANRVKRVATGWEPQLTLAVDSIISRATVMELCGAFFSLLILLRGAEHMRWLFVYPNIFFYGCAMHAAGFFMPPITRKLAWTFCILGAATLVILPMFTTELNSKVDHLTMGFFFGVLHLAYGIYLSCTKEPPKSV